MKFSYNGFLVDDCSVIGERKIDGVIPAHCAPALQLSNGIWIIFYATLDMRGHDASRSIIYQLRKGAPDGALLKEACLVPNLPEWDALGNGEKYWKCIGMPMAFGVPKGAKQNSGNENVFFLKWYRYAHKFINNVLENSGSGQYPGTKDVMNKTLRIECLQFRLNYSEDDIELLSEAGILAQNGYNKASEFCELGPGHTMNHSMMPPVPVNQDCTEWVEYATINPWNSGVGGHGSVVPIKYSFNFESGLYEWTDTGTSVIVPGEMLGESSICRLNGGDFIVALRSFSSNNTVLLKTSDPFSAKFSHIKYETGNTPRAIVKTARESILLLTNNISLSRYNEKRNPLFCYKIDHKKMQFSAPMEVFDAHKNGLPFRIPFIDMPKLFPEHDGRQQLVFRAINRNQTVGNMPKVAGKTTEEEILNSGIHSVLIEE